MSDARLWLASGSPRRRTLLEWVGVPVDVHPPDVDETWDPACHPVDHARLLATRKVATAPDDRVALAADTVVHLDEGGRARILDKPAHRDQARAHLIALSGRWHQVTTGVAARLGDRVLAFTTTTDVRFRALPAREIEAYLATGEADDKAGAYGIQGRAGAFVAEVRGSWTNVVGLPLEPTLEVLAQLGLEPRS